MQWCFLIKICEEQQHYCYDVFYLLSSSHFFAVGILWWSVNVSVRIHTPAPARAAGQGFPRPHSAAHFTIRHFHIFNCIFFYQPDYMKTNRFGEWWGKIQKCCSQTKLFLPKSKSEIKEEAFRQILFVNKNNTYCLVQRLHTRYNRWWYASVKSNNK